MNKKRFVALLAAVVMILGTVPVYATEVNVATEGAATITGDATVGDVERPDTFKVTLPTAAMLGFYVDPHNLVGLASGESAVIDPNATGQGAILPADEVALIKNQSNVDVKVTMTIDIISTGDALVIEDTQADVTDEDSDTQELFLAIVPGVTNVVTGQSTYVATGSAIALTEAEDNEVAFKLAAATYEVTNDGTSLDYGIQAGAANYDAVGFQFGGVVNKSANWANQDGELKVAVVFDVAKWDASADELVENSGLYGLAAGTVVDYSPVKWPEKLTVTPNGTGYILAAKDTTVKFSTVANADDSVKVNLTTGVKVNGQAVTATVNATTGQITITTANLTKVLGSTLPSELKFVVTTADNTTYEVNYKVK